MKICLITSVHPRYDIRIFVKEAKTLATKHDVSLIVADGLHDETHSGIKIYDVGKLSGGSRIKRILLARRLIYAKLNELKPELVHFHDPELIKLGLRLSKDQVKVIYDVHEDTPLQILSKYWIPKFLRPILAKYIFNLEKTASKKFYGIISATDLIAKRFINYNPNTCVIYNYPILSEMINIDVPYNTRKRELTYIGSISRNRGILPILDALLEANLSLDLAGVFSEPDLEQCINNHPARHLVNYHGLLNRAQIVRLLSEVRIGLVTLFATPSYLESLPIKLFEYMLAGIPVIASNFSLWEKIVLKHNCGLLIDPNDASAIAKAALSLIDNPNLAARLGANGKQAVLKYYNWEVQAKKLLEFYDKLKLTEF